MSRCNLVEKNDSLTLWVSWPERGDVPLSDAFLDAGQTGEIHSFHLCEADIDEADTKFFRN